MKQNTDTNRHPRRLLATLLALAAVGIAVVVVAITATGGSNTASHLAGGGRPAPAIQAAKTSRPPAPRMVRVTRPPARAPKANKPPAPKPAGQSRSAIPQNNGGDSDSDNNGGPSDGDGDI